MKVVVDNNVLISAYLLKAISLPADVILLCESKGWTVVLSEDMLIEFIDVVTRKFRSFGPESIKAIVAGFREDFEVVNPTVSLDMEVPDPDDRMLFECAFFAGAEVIVTGDKRLWKVDTKGADLKVMSPRQFIETYS